jgi:hypothetical protein
MTMRYPVTDRVAALVGILVERELAVLALVAALVLGITSGDGARVVSTFLVFYLIPLPFLVYFDKSKRRRLKRLLQRGT